jgi:hypothetical protein
MAENERNARRIVNDIVVQHDAFRRMLQRMEDLWRDAQAHIPIVAPFIGETGTGKSTAIKTFVAKHPPKRTPDGLVIPVLAINTPSKPTPRTLAERILRALGDPRPTAGSASAKLDRIVMNMAAAQVRVMALDDMHHFVDKRQHVALFDAADYLKELLVSYDHVLMCFGLPECELVIESNEQLKTRSKAAFELARFDWMDEASQDQFVAVLAAFQGSIPGFDLPELASPDVSIRMYLATGGLIRYVSAILSKAVRAAIDRSKTKVRLEDLGAAWSEEVVGANKDYPNPFRREFRLNDLQAKIDMAKTMGRRVARPTASRARKPRAVLAEVGL